jgi:hypothetical protein
MESTFLIGNSNIVWNSSPAVDTDLPATPDGDGGHIGRYCCFYAARMPGQISIEDMDLNGFRFGIGYLSAYHPRFTRINFKLCNACVFAYLASQRAQLSDISCEVRTGPAFIAAAQFIPQDAYLTYPELYNDATADESWADGTTFYRGQFNNGMENSSFDTWFQDSIMRPTEMSYGAFGGMTYPHAVSDIESKPSGWAIAFAPFRNGRTAYGWAFDWIDSRGFSSTEQAPHFGLVLLNTTCANFSVTRPRLEHPYSLMRDYFVLMDASEKNNISELTTMKHPDGSARNGVRFTDSAGPSISFYDCDFQIPPVVDTADAGDENILQKNSYFKSGNHTNGSYHATSLKVVDGSGTYFRAQVSPDPDCFSLGDAFYSSHGVAGGVGLIGLSTVDGGLIHGGRIFALPKYSPQYSKWHDKVNLEVQANLGTLIWEVAAINMKTGVRDYGKVLKVHDTSAGISVTTANDVNNGDDSVLFTGDFRYEIVGYLPMAIGATGELLFLRRRDLNNKAKVWFVSPICGLASPIPAGTVLTVDTSVSAVLTNFSNGLLNFSNLTNVRASVQLTLGSLGNPVESSDQILCKVSASHFGAIV